MLNWRSHTSYGGWGTVLESHWRRSQKTVSLMLIWICIGLFLITTGLDVMGISPRRQTMLLLGLSYEGLVHHWLFYQLITAPLLHANITHLLFNMLSLWMLGPGIERTLGRRYLVFSLLCALSSMVGWLLLSWGSGHVLMGYSGVIFGLLVAQATFYPDSLIVLFALFPIKMKYGVLLLAAVELYLTISPEDPSIAHAAHLLGAVTAWGYLRFLNWRAARAVARSNGLQFTINAGSPGRRSKRSIPFEL